MEITIKLTADGELLKALQSISSGIMAICQRTAKERECIELHKEHETPDREDKAAGKQADSRGTDVKANAVTAEANTAGSSKIEIVEVRKALKELADAKGKEVSMGVLEGFGVKKLTELSPENYGKAMELVKGLMM